MAVATKNYYRPARSWIFLSPRNNKWQCILITLHDAFFWEKQTSTDSDDNSKAHIIAYFAKCFGLTYLILKTNL